MITQADVPRILERVARRVRNVVAVGDRPKVLIALRETYTWRNYFRHLDQHGYSILGAVDAITADVLLVLAESKVNAAKLRGNAEGNLEQQP